jgi:hypothetical protein
MNQDLEASTAVFETAMKHHRSRIEALLAEAAN